VRLHGWQRMGAVRDFSYIRKPDVFAGSNISEFHKLSFVKLMVKQVGDLACMTLVRCLHTGMCALQGCGAVPDTVPDIADSLEAYLRQCIRKSLT
jgi:hypothetical protein